MKHAWLLLLMIGMACSKHHDPGFTSAAGNWGYTSPDNNVKVTFTLVKNSSGGLDIQQYAITLQGVQYNAYAVISGVSLPVIQKIHINANDAKAVYSYDIEFDNCTVSRDFKTITAATGFYTWPNSSQHTLTAAIIMRN